MLYIILSIFCSVTVAVLLKSAKRYKISIIQCVTVNYLTALILCFFFFKPELVTISASAPWSIYIALAVLLPTIFLVLAASVKNLGIVKTDIAQRLSLFIPILAAYFIFKEEFSQLKFIGLVIGLVAILLTFLRKTQSRESSKKWIYPIVVFIGFGVIDVLFKQIALFKDLPYTSSLFIVFCLSFIMSLIIVISMIAFGKTKFEFVNIICGFILGIFNFGNILFYLKAHQALAKNPSTVFAAMNLGVIILGTFIGILFFKERLSKLNYAGIGLAMVAIILITISQLYVI